MPATPPRAAPEKTAPSAVKQEAWPDLPYEAWKDSCATLHMWTQIVGKIRLAATPWLNHSWHVPLYVSARGLTTSVMHRGARAFEIEFDFVDHRLLIRASDAMPKSMALQPRSVADFYRELRSLLGELGLDIVIHARPNEVADAIPFEQDEVHADYDPDHVNRFWRVLLQADRVFKQFRGGFVGKSSPVHFFWGSFDLALTRFSGRPAPLHPGGVPNCPDAVMQEAYSHELCSCGFWPGSEALPEPAFYAYAYPEPPGYRTSRVRPDAARHDASLGEFILPYAALAQADAADGMLLDFLESTYEAAATAGGWDRKALERRQ